MSEKRKAPGRRVVVKGKSGSVTVFPWVHSGTGERWWRFGWKDVEGKWRYVSRKVKAEAEAEAVKRLAEMEAGGLELAGLAGSRRRFLEAIHREVLAGDEEAVLAMLRARRKSADLGESVKRFLAWKVEKAGEETRHLANVRRDVAAVAVAFHGQAVVDVSPAELKAWWDARVKGKAAKTRNDVRANLVAFWNWARWDGIFPKEVTPAEKLPKAVVGHGERRVLTVKELAAVLGMVDVRWRAWVVLGAFCGLRPEEIAPQAGAGMSKKGKRGIHAEEIDFRFRVIHLPAEVSKVKTPRKVPLSEAALQWLAWAGVEEGQTGPVCLLNPSEEGETARLGKEVFGDGWPQDALRHSYGSFRNAVLRNLPQVAEEMGTSEAMLRRHYHNPKTTEEGEEWFALRPNVPICSDSEQVLGEDIGERSAHNA